MALMPALWRMRFALLRKLGFAALIGLVVALVGLIAAGGSLSTILIVIGLLAIAPEFIYFFMVTIWHWKARYRGSHSDLWGALLLMETSGWFKLVYLFRHIIPDARQSGRYAGVSTPQV
jgi:hypothetical protein